MGRQHSARARPPRSIPAKWMKKVFRSSIVVAVSIYTFLTTSPRTTVNKWVKAVVWSAILVMLVCYTVISTTGLKYRFNVLSWSSAEDDQAMEEDKPLPDNMTWVQLQQHRVQHLAAGCKALNISQPLDHNTLKHLLVDTKHKVIMCFVPKVACTSWKRMWFWLTGLVEEQEDVNTLSRTQVHGPFLSSLASTRFADERREEMLKTYKKFMFTRHPMGRLVSAYRDKLENEDVESNFDFHKHVGQEVERMVRGKYGNKHGGHDVTFREFITWVTPPNGTWTPAQMNEHWRPMVELCAPCTVKYDVVGRYENLRRDVNETLHWLGAGHLAERFPKPDRPSHATSLLREYLQRLSTRERLRFLRTYLLDFLLFGYEMT